MSLQTALTAAVALASLVAAALAGAVVGVGLGERASTPATEVLALEAPERSAAVPASAPRSDGGFTGFGGLPGLPGEVVRSGTVVEARDGELVVERGDGRAAVRFEDPTRLFRIRPLEGELRPGDLVLLRVIDGRAGALLRVPPDLEEGAGR